jgi:hypothetical protein
MAAIGCASPAELRVAREFTDPVTFAMKVDLYTPGETTSGVQFDFVYNPELLKIVSVQPADSLDGQSKGLSTSEPNKGVLRLVVIGMNAFPILNGRLVNVTFQLAAGANDTASVQLLNMKAVSPNGDEVRVVSVQPQGTTGRTRRIRAR